MDERAGWNFAERKVATERVAEQCASRHVRPRDTFDIIEDGMRWSIAMAGERNGVVATVIPEHWVEEDYSMRDWL